LQKNNLIFKKNEKQDNDLDRGGRDGPRGVFGLF
jgi:hypothetical protein